MFYWNKYKLEYWYLFNGQLVKFDWTLKPRYSGYLSEYDLMLLLDVNGYDQ